MINYADKKAELVEQFNQLSQLVNDLADKARTLKSRTALESTLLSRIERYANGLSSIEMVLKQVLTILPDENDSNQTKPPALKRLETQLKEWNRAIKEMAASLEEVPVEALTIIHKIEQYTNLIDQINQKYKEKIPKRNSEHTRVDKAIEQLSLHRDNYNNIVSPIIEQISAFRGSSADMEKLYEQALPTLTMYNEKFDKLKTNMVQEKHQATLAEQEFNKQAKSAEYFLGVSQELLRLTADYRDETLAKSHQALVAHYTLMKKQDLKIKNMRGFNEKAQQLIDDLKQQHLKFVNEEVEANFSSYYSDNQDIREKIDTFQLTNTELKNLDKKAQKLVKKSYELTPAERDNQWDLIHKQNKQLIDNVNKGIHDLLKERRNNEKKMATIETQKSTFFSNNKDIIEKTDKYQLQKQNDKANHLLTQAKELEKKSANLSLQERKEQWAKINQQNAQLLSAVDSEISDLLQNRIDTAISGNETAAAAIIAKAHNADLSITQEELAVFRQLRLVKSGNYSSIPLMEEELAHFATQQKLISERMKEAERITNTHLQAKELSKRENIHKLIHHMNNERSGDLNPLFKAMISNKIRENIFIKDIETHFATLTRKGRKKLHELVKLFKSSDRQAEMNDKLELISLLDQHGLNYLDWIELINTPSKVKEFLYLVTHPTVQSVSKEFLQNLLNNPHLSATLLILGEHDVQLTEAALQSLVNNPDICEVIIQQHKLNNNKNDEDRTKLKSELFKQLITDCIIPMEPDLARSFLAYSKLDNEFCQPWLLVYLKESQLSEDGRELYDIFLNNEHQESNLIFMKTLFTSSTGMSLQLSNNAYFSPNENDRAISVESFIGSHLSHRWKKPLSAIAAANKDSGKYDLALMAQFMTRVNAQLRSNPDFKTSEVNRFMRLCIPWILSTDPLDKKQKHVQNVAHVVFTQKHEKARLLGDILQIITGAFVFIAPIRLITGRNAFFSEQKTDTEKTVGRVMSELTNPSPSNEPDTESLLPSDDGPKQ